MPIAITSEHNDLADSVRSLVERVAPSDVLHEALETPISNPPPYWKAAAEQGLQGVHLAESVGGQGFVSSTWRSCSPSSATARCQGRSSRRRSPAR